MADVRSLTGVPPASAFSSTSGTPVVVDRDTGTGYVMKTDGSVVALGGGSGGGGAPADASYVTLGTNAALTAERVLTAGSGISITDGGAAGPLTVAATAKAATSYVNFGSASNTRLTATVTDAAVTPASIVSASWGAVLNTDDNDPELDDITFNAIPGTGSFTLVASCRNKLLGRCRVNYTVA